MSTRCSTIMASPREAAHMRAAPRRRNSVTHFQDVHALHGINHRIRQGGEGVIHGSYGHGGEPKCCKSFLVDTLTLTVEHRAGASQKPIKFELAQSGEALALQLVAPGEPAIPVPSTLDERITSALAEAASPLPFGELRSKCRVRAATLYERLAALTTSGRIVKAGERGYQPRWLIILAPGPTMRQQ
jgi:hypothetical protein